MVLGIKSYKNKESYSKDLDVIKKNQYVFIGPTYPLQTTHLKKICPAIL